MENREKRPSTDEIKLKFVQRIMLLGFGSMVACVMLGAVAVFGLWATPNNERMAVPQPIYVGDNGPADVADIPIGMDTVESGSMGGVEVLVGLVLFLTLVFAIGYGVYDMFRLYLQYRRVKDVEDVMFP